MRLGNKIAIITGGGSGLGRASSLLFSQEGAKIVIAQRSESSGEETVATINSGGGKAIFIRTDVSKPVEVERLIKVTMDSFGRIDILFNNAGMDQKPVPIDDIDESAWDAIYAVNVRGIFLTTKYAVPSMKKVRSGVIITTASISGVRPRMNSAAYASSKGAAIALTKALAIELAPYNIRVNCINPVVTDTNMTRQEAADVGGWEQYQKAIQSTIPLGRLARPEDTAYAALYLASDESSMLTGTAINVDGGRGI